MFVRGSVVVANLKFRHTSLNGARQRETWVMHDMTRKSAQLTDFWSIEKPENKPETYKQPSAQKLFEFCTFLANTHINPAV
jgi:hypothetical protein